MGQTPSAEEEEAVPADRVATVRSFLGELGVLPPTTLDAERWSVSHEDIRRLHKAEGVFWSLRHLKDAWGHCPLEPSLTLTVRPGEHAEEALLQQWEMYRPLLRDLVAACPGEDVLVPVSWCCYYDRGQGGPWHFVGHETLLHIDTRERVHTFLDPHDFHFWGHATTLSHGMEQRVLLNDYRSRVVRWPTASRSLQGAWEPHNPEEEAMIPGNVCSPLILLVTACCLRFGWYDLGAVARTLRDVALAERRRGVDAHTRLRTGLWRWVLALIRGGRPHVGPADPDARRWLGRPAGGAPGASRPHADGLGDVGPVCWHDGSQALRAFRRERWHVTLGLAHFARAELLHLPSERPENGLLAVLVAPDEIMQRHMDGELSAPMMRDPATLARWSTDLCHRLVGDGHTRVWLDLRPVDERWAEVAAAWAESAATGTPPAPFAASVIGHEHLRAVWTRGLDVGDLLYLLRPPFAGALEEEVLGGPYCDRLVLLEAECDVRSPLSEVLRALARVLLTCKGLVHARVTLVVVDGTQRRCTLPDLETLWAALEPATGNVVVHIGVAGGRDPLDPALYDRRATGGVRLAWRRDLVAPPPD